MKLFSSVNRKIKFREKDYVEKNYIRSDGKAEIPIYLKKIDDIYMKHDRRRLVLSDAMIDYIEEVASIIPFKYDIVLQFHCEEKMTEDDKDRVRRIVKNNFGMEIDDIDYENRMNNYMAAGLTILGIILIVIAYLVEETMFSVIQEILLIVGWVLLWDMLEAILFDNNKRKIKRLNKLQLYDAKFEFVDISENAKKQ